MATDSQVGTDRTVESAIAFLIVSFSRKLIQNHRLHYPLQVKTLNYIIIKPHHIAPRVFYGGYTR